MVTNPEGAAFLIWPDNPLPVPRVRALAGEWVADPSWTVDRDEPEALMTFIEASPVNMHYIAVPDELWMRELLRLDLSSLAELTQFSNTFGMLWAPSLGRQAESQRLASQLARDLRRFRNLARVLLTVIGDAPEEATSVLEDDSPGGAVSITRTRTIHRGQVESGLLRWTAAQINRELVSMHPSLAFNEIGSGITAEAAMENILNREFSLANVLAVQMFNFAVQRPHVSHCEQCKSAYVRHRGRSQYGGHRSDTGKGVKYCSATCANTAAQQRYRDRQRQQKAQEVTNDEP